MAISYLNQMPVNSEQERIATIEYLLFEEHFDLTLQKEERFISSYFE